MLRVIILALLLAGCTNTTTLDSGRHIKRAERYASEGRLDDAITEYRAHLDSRLEMGERPGWENPWFYLLIIGDLQLEKGDVDAALASYEEAEQKGVDRSLIADRYRHAGSYLAEHGQMHRALQILTKYRDRDPLLIDSMRDRIAREIVSDEDTK